MAALRKAEREAEREALHYLVLDDTLIRGRASSADRQRLSLAAGVPERLVGPGRLAPVFGR
jgi:hypothetical protein